jgi:competence protein ComGC
MKPSQSMASRAGFTFGELMVVLVVIALLVALFVPVMSKAKARSGRSTCVNNLRQISLAFKQWPIDSTDNYPTQVSVTNGGTMELNQPKILICPEEPDTNRLIAHSFSGSSYENHIPFTNNNNVSYFIGVDAADAWPQMLLVGDSHFAIGGKRVTPSVVRLGTNSPVGWPRPIRTRHERGGNIGLTDGSVMNTSDNDFRLMLRNSGDATNRLAIP